MGQENAPPIEGYESLPFEALQRRIRALPAEQVRQLIAYEESHGQRAKVLELLHDRLHALEEGAESPRGQRG